MFQCFVHPVRGSCPVDTLLALSCNVQPLGLLQTWDATHGLPSVQECTTHMHTVACCRRCGSQPPPPRPRGRGPRVCRWDEFRQGMDHVWFLAHADPCLCGGGAAMPPHPWAHAGPLTRHAVEDVITERLTPPRRSPPGPRGRKR